MYSSSLIAMYLSMKTLGILETPCDYFWKDLLESLNDLILFRLITTGITQTSSSLCISDKYMIFPFSETMFPPSKYCLYERPFVLT